MNYDENAAKKAKRQIIGLSILCGFLALILALMIAGTAILDDLVGKANYVDPENEQVNDVPPDDVDPDVDVPIIDPGDHTHDTTEDDEVMYDKDIYNLLLVGQDRRPGEGRQRSDSMILVSFNKKTGAISMVSFLRDTYVYIPGYGSEKLNAAYAHKGFGCLFETLKVNFGIVVDAGVEVDFLGFEQIIDMLGGVTINITQKESDYMKKNWGIDVPAGVNRLNGNHALYYSRIRKLDMDAKRAERQRKVLMSLIDEYKNKDAGEMLRILYEIMPLITTTMKEDEVVNRALNLFPMLSKTEIATQQIPAAGTYTDMTVGTVTATKVADMEVNRQILKELLGY